MAAAVSNADGLGSVAASLLSPSVLRDQVAIVRSLTDQPFQINLFVQDTPSPTPEVLAEAAELLRPSLGKPGLEGIDYPPSLVRTLFGPVRCPGRAATPGRELYVWHSDA
ncbi:nitronate monooxygenase [Massilia sp. H-1]|nr:nitronate monooxygenase [Massilia sp. H-1]